jgi:hypothetical protein
MGREATAADQHSRTGFDPAGCPCFVLRAGSPLGSASRGASAPDTPSHTRLVRATAAPARRGGCRAGFTVAPSLCRLPFFSPGPFLSWSLLCRRRAAAVAAVVVVFVGCFFLSLCSLSDPLFRLMSCVFLSPRPTLVFLAWFLTSCSRCWGCEVKNAELLRSTGSPASAPAETWSRQAGCRS